MCVHEKVSVESVRGVRRMTMVRMGDEKVEKGEKLRRGEVTNILFFSTYILPFSFQHKSIKWQLDISTISNPMWRDNNLSPI